MAKQKKAKKEPAGLVPEVDLAAANAALLETLDEDRQDEIVKEARRAAMASSLARNTWTIATQQHRLEDGSSRLDFKQYPFQPEIIQDDGIERVVYGSSQWGKSELAICVAAAAAANGLKVLWVISKNDKRNTFVAGRIDPCFGMVPLYRAMMKQANDRNAKSDNTHLKHFGPGSINFVIATAARDFTTYGADFVIVDEHQECDQTNLIKIDDRLSGSPFRLKLFMGHPTTTGTQFNQNLDWLYQNSDRREWHVPCKFCGMEQVLGWWSHCIYEERNRQGGILSIRPRDEDYKPKRALDIRPVCTNCHRPMFRLTREARWKAQEPGMIRHGFRLGNLYNPNVRLDALYQRYLSARHKPSQMAEFVNKQLGMTYNVDGAQIGEAMLAECSTGDSSGVEPYRFIPCSAMDWRRLENIELEQEEAA